MAEKNPKTPLTEDQIESSKKLVAEMEAMLSRTRALLTQQELILQHLQRSYESGELDDTSPPMRAETRQA